MNELEADFILFHQGFIDDENVIANMENCIHGLIDKKINPLASLLPESSSENGFFIMTIQYTRKKR